MANPSSRTELNRLAQVLDCTLRVKLPNDTFLGPLRGLEAEIRQEAMFLLTQRFLSGNFRLMCATEDGHHDEVGRELLRSLGAALKYAGRSLRRKVFRDLKRTDKKPEGPGGSCEHPSRLGYWSLPIAVQIELALKALQLAVAKQAISAGHAKMASALLETASSQTELSRRLGVSRQAIHQRLRPVRITLHRIIEELEFPLL